MSTYVLIHGGSVDGSVWDAVSAFLRAEGHSVFAPSLSDEKTSSLNAHVREACAAVDGAGGTVILAGHSYGGMVITGAADRVREKIERIVYIDAAVPDPGQSLFDVIRAAGCDPLSFDGLEPLPPYVEKLEYDVRAWSQLPKSYIRCTQSAFAAVCLHAAEKVSSRLREDHWSYRELQSGHTPMRTMPDKLAELM